MAAKTNNQEGMMSTRGCVQTWSFWRRCCCRYGWYPILVAPIVTTALLLDVTSSVGCQFIHVGVGFTPSNQAWNESTAEIGLFYFNNQEEFGRTNALKETFAPGCNSYPEAFESFFIEGDKTWTAARIMAIISLSAGLLSVLMAWLMVVSPLPAGFFWPGVLLPAAMVAFLAAGSKFLFFDTKICQGFVWFPFGENATPRTANTCTLGKTGEIAIAAAAVYFFSLLLVCLKTPQPRQLIKGYGKSADTAAVRALQEDDMMNSSVNSSDEENQYFATIAPLPSGIIESNSSSDILFEASDGLVSDPSDELYMKGSEDPLATKSYPSKTVIKEQLSDFDCIIEERGESFETDGNDDDKKSPDRRDDVASLKSSNDPGVEVRLGSSNETLDADGQADLKMMAGSVDDDEDRGYLPYLAVAARSYSPRKVSESRLSKKEKMEVGSHNDELIDKFVLEFDKSFTTDDESSTIADHESVSTMASF